jgi:hypothetical protein
MDHELIDRVLAGFLATPQADRSSGQIELMAGMICRAAGAETALATAEQQEHLKLHAAIKDLANELGDSNHYTHLVINDKGTVLVSTALFLRGSGHVCASGNTAAEVMDQIKHEASILTAATLQ